MIAIFCPNCNRIQHIKDQQNEQEYKVEDGPPCCQLSEPEQRLIAAIFGKEYEQVTIREVPQKRHQSWTAGYGFGP